CEEDLAVAFQPFAEALAHHLLHADEATRDRVLSLWSGSLQRLVPHLAGPPVQGDASVEQWMLLEAIVDWLALVSAEHPVVLVLDDVHWAARPTLLALLHLGRAERLTGVLTLCTYRDTEVDRAHPLSEALADLRREPTVERMRIRGLGAEEVLDFVERSGTDAPSAWAAAIGDHTQGNPFFLGEVLLHLSESGALGEATTDLSNIGVPEGVRDVVGRRLSRLSTTAGTLLTVAAVVGPEFAVDVVAEVAETPIGKAVDAFDQAMATGLIVETTEAGRLAFVHALVRQTLELELSTLRRVQLHRSIGFALEARWADDPGEMAVDLAYHFREAAASGADERRRAARYTRIVGEQAMHRLAYGEAGDCFALAADLRPRDTPADRIERDELLALLMTCRGQENSFGAAIAAALARCEDALAHGDDLALVTTTTAMAVYHIGRQFDLDELAMIDAALAIDLDDVSVAGRRVLNLEGDWQPAETINLEEWRLLGLMVCSVFGLTLGPRATSVLPAGWPTMYASRFDGEPSNDFDDVNGRGFAAVTLIGVPGARRQLELALQSMQSGRRQGRSRRIGPGPEWPALAALARLGRLDELRHFAEASREMGDRSHSAVLSVVARMAIVMEQLVRGRLDEAASGLDVLRAIAPREPQALFGLTLLTIALSLARGRNVDAAADVEALLELRPSFTFVRGAVAGGVGDIDMCQSVLADWRAEGRHVPENVNRSIKLWALTEAAFAAHDEDAAATLSELLAPYDGELLLAVSNFLPASAAFCLGMCAQTMGDLDLARSHYEDALAFEMQIGAETLATRTRERISLICAR
ncbi:MAG TPA: hypothetical protein VK461_01440, partial [Acidimicrobiales bacterium]|nr:hypothetical protein [Acidimicrobiales bacterium]